MLKTTAAALFAALLGALSSPAQVFTLSRDQLLKYTAQWQGERFPDGRPKAPDALLEKVKALTSDDVFTARGLQGQYVDGLQVLNPGKKLVGRAVTLQLAPDRADVSGAVRADWSAKGNQGVLNHQTALDLLQRGDVIVIDAFGSIPAGGIIGDNLAYYIWKTTGAGFVIDGAIRDVEGVAQFGMPGYFRGATPPAIHGTMVMGINIPVRIGNTTVMPGDVVLGDGEGVTFIPPHLVEQAVTAAEAARAQKLRDRAR
jgi:4-hydroxy-4-methyl-2-oxoglutarate aldolase